MPEYTPAQIDARIQADPEMQALAKDDETEFLARHEQMYNTFGYNADGTPMSTAMKGMRKVSEKTGLPHEVVQGIANIPIPLATTIAGAAAGSAGLPGPGTIVGGSMGSVAGEYINYGLGLRDKPGAVDVGVAAAAPMLGPLASRAKSGMSNLVQGMPGSGKHMHNLAAEEIKKKIGHMETTKDMVEFMRQGFQHVPSFKADVPGVRALVDEELSTRTKSLMIKSNQSGKITDPYIQKLNNLRANLSTKKTFSFEELMATERDFIEHGAEDSTGAWKRLSGVLINDLEKQAANPKYTPQTREKILKGVESYKNYVAVNKRYQGGEQLKTFLNRSVTEVDDGMVRFNKSSFLKELHSGKLDMFEKSELNAIEDAVKDLGYIGAAPKSLSSGMTHTGSYGAAGLAAYSAAGVKGVVATAAILGTLRLALSTEMGRRVVTSLAKKGHGRIDAMELKNVMGQVTAGASAGIVAGVSGAGTKTRADGTMPIAMENQQ